MDKKKLNFEECFRYLEFTQYMKLCEILGVDVVNRQALREEGDASLYRNNFDEINRELIEKFYKLGRMSRRQLLRYLRKAVNANMAARRYISEGITEQYNAGVKALNEGILNNIGSDE